jgi:hypothetical protein
MSVSEIKREILPGGDIRLSSGDCTFVYRRPRPGVLHVTIAGCDGGQFGTATLDEIHTAVGREGSIELFVDARGATVSEDWTRFFSVNREKLSRVHILVGGSKVVHLTIAISQHLSRTGDLIRIYSDPESFAAKLDNAR